MIGWRPATGGGARLVGWRRLSAGGPRLAAGREHRLNRRNPVHFGTLRGILGFYKESLGGRPIHWQARGERQSASSGRRWLPEAGLAARDLPRKVRFVPSPGRGTDGY